MAKTLLESLPETIRKVDLLRVRSRIGDEEGVLRARMLAQPTNHHGLETLTIDWE